MDKSSPNRLVNSTLLCNLELSIEESLLGASATTVFSHVDLGELFTDPALTEEALKTLVVVAATIIEFNLKLKKNKTRKQLIELLKTPKYKEITDKILSLQPGVITSVKVVSETFLYPTVIINDVEVPIIFLHTVNGKEVPPQEN
jgi:hypothetical protein